MLELTIRTSHAAFKKWRAHLQRVGGVLFDRIQRYDPILKSIICTNPQAMASGAGIDEDWQQHGKWAGPIAWRTGFTKRQC